MTSKLIGIVALTAALVPGIGNAIGLGELTLHSRIGETLRAELPILATDEASVASACFSLVAMPGSDLPVITAAKTRLIRRGQAYILQIVGSKPINEPIFAIAVQAGCGHDVIRDFVLIPEPPLMQAEAQPTSGAYPVSSARTARSDGWQARDSETIERVADAPPKKPSPPRAKSKPKPRMAPAAKGGDQLRLGAAPDETRPTPKSSSGLQADTEERLLKLETTLHLLAHEIEKMDQALELASKVIEAQGKLTLAQSLPAPALPAAPTISAPPPAPNAPQSASWMELLISAALGAAISVGLAQYFGRRQRSPGEDQIPLALATHSAPAHSAHPHTAPTPTPAKPEASSPPEKSAPPRTAGVLDITENIAAPAIPLPLAQSLPEEIPEASAEPGIVDISTEDEYSVLELAEIMLAFGRVRGAADTLAEYVEQNLPKSIQPWSMLLDLYRRGGMREEFEALAEKMHNRFNASIPAWSDSLTPISGLKALEDYPHIIQKASADWGSQACLDYLLGLISDTRAGLRNGFPLEVVEEIVLLMRILEDGYGRKRAA